MTENRLRVLYADDEDDVREVFAAVFGADFDVTIVPSGAEALAVLASAEFDVLVSDMRMDPMKGSRASRARVRRASATCSASCSRATAITTISPTR